MHLLQWLLLPFSMLFGGITWIRNKMYDLNWKISYTPEVLTISVGNLIAGGSGKTPMIMYLIEKYASTHRIAVLSRGYGRSSKGFRWVESGGSAKELGDEPLMIKRKYPKIVVAVCEDRTEGIKKMISVESFDLLLLDDAFQHRKVNPHIQILLSAFDRPYFADLPLPSGRLREFRSGARRADALVFTKVPPDTGESQRSKYKSKVDVALRNSTFFAEYKMPEPLLVNGIDPLGRIILVTGIAYSKLLLAHLQKSREVLHFKFKDHHTYTDADMRKINESMNDETLVVTTAKDWVKWKDFEEIWKKWNLAVADQEVSFYQEKDFDAFLDKQFAKYGKSQT